MSIMQSWKEGFGLLQPKNLRLFLLVTMKNTGDAYKLLLPYWGLLFVGKLLLYLTFPYPNDPTLVPFISGASFSWMIGKFYDLVCLYIVCLACRPSLGRKTLGYFTGRMLDLIRVIAAQIILGVFFLICVSLPVFLLSGLFQSVGNIISRIVNFLSGNLLGPSLWVMINIFFLEDDSALWQSVRNTIWFVCYNYPIILVFNTFCSGLIWLLHQLQGIVGSLVHYNSFVVLLITWIGHFIFWPFIVSLFINLYIQRAYEYADLYSA